MRLLFDTHIWVWALLEPSRLSDRVVAALQAPESEIWLSPVSVWELLILIERGRVVVDAEPGRWVSEALRGVPLREAPLTHQVALESRRLRFKHADPADRFLAATARVYDLTLVTADERLLGSSELSTLANRPVGRRRR